MNDSGEELHIYAAFFNRAMRHSSSGNPRRVAAAKKMFPSNWFWITCILGKRYDQVTMLRRGQASRTDVL